MSHTYNYQQSFWDEHESGPEILLQHLKAGSFVNVSVHKYFEDLNKLERDYTRRLSAINSKYSEVFSAKTPDYGKLHKTVLMNFLSMQKTLIQKHGKLVLSLDNDLLPDFKKTNSEYTVTYQTFESKINSILLEKSNLKSTIKSLKSKLNKIQIQLRECELNLYNQLGIKETEQLNRDRKKWKLLQSEMLSKLQVLEQDYLKLQRHWEQEWFDISKVLQDWELGRMQQILDVYYQYSNLKVDYNSLEQMHLEKFRTGIMGMNLKQDIASFAYENGTGRINSKLFTTTSENNNNNTNNNTNNNNHNHNIHDKSRDSLHSGTQEVDVSGASNTHTSNNNNNNNNNNSSKLNGVDHPLPSIPPRGSVARSKSRVYEETLRKLSNQLNDYQSNGQEKHKHGLQPGLGLDPSRMSSMISHREENTVNDTINHSRVDQTCYPQEKTIDNVVAGKDTYYDHTELGDYTDLNIHGRRRRRNTHREEIDDITYQDLDFNRVPKQHGVKKNNNAHNFNETSLMEITQDDFIDEYVNHENTILHEYSESDEDASSYYYENQNEKHTQCSPSRSPVSRGRPLSYNTSVTTFESENMIEKDVRPKMPTSTTLELIKSIPDMEKSGSSWNSSKVRSPERVAPSLDAGAMASDTQENSNVDLRFVSVSTTRILPQVPSRNMDSIESPVSDPTPSKHSMHSEKPISPQKPVSVPQLQQLQAYSPATQSTSSHSYANKEIDPLRAAVERMRREREARKLKQELAKNESLMQQNQQMAHMASSIAQTGIDDGRVSSFTGAKLVPFPQKKGEHN